MAFFHLFVLLWQLRFEGTMPLFEKVLCQSQYGHLVRHEVPANCKSPIVSNSRSGGKAEVMSSRSSEYWNKPSILYHKYYFKTNNKMYCIR